MELLSKDTPFGISMILAGGALLFFSTLVFFGLNYHFAGDFLIPITFIAIGWIVIGICVIQMCKSKKRYRLRDGWSVELALALIALGMIMCGTVPCSNFMKVNDHKEEFINNIDSTIAEVKDISHCYRDYAERRCTKYEQKHFSDGKGLSLRRRLLPPNINKIEDEREAWLDNMGEVNLWNVFTPRNVVMIKTAGVTWLDEYRLLSEIIFKDEAAVPFDIPGLEERLDQLYFAHSRMRGVDKRGIMLGGVCYLVVMIPYLLVRRNRKYRKK